MQSCKVAVSICAFGGGDDLYQPIGMSEASLKKVCYVQDFLLLQNGRIDYGEFVAMVLIFSLLADCTADPEYDDFIKCRAMILFFDIDPNTQQVCYAFTFYIITSILTKKLFGIKLWVVLAITRASGLLKKLLVLINYIYGLSNRRIELLCTSSRSFLLEFLVCLSLKCGCVLVAFCLYMFLTKVPLMCLLLL
ncbi:hypothetical protein V6Z11_D08G143900 [Gossypium hirsutum]